MRARIAHISDLHFGRVDPSAVAALAGDLRERAPDLVVVSGDLTQRARTHQFQEARAFLDSLERPVLVVPGNHDVPWHDLPGRFFGPHGRFRRLIAPDLRPVTRSDGLVVAGLPTSRAVVPHWNWSLGHISTSGAKRVAEVFRLHPGPGLRVLVTHHPLTPVAGWGARHVAFNADRALDILAGARVDLLLAGHVHVSGAGPVALPGGWTALSVQAASAVSTRLRGEPNAYNLLDLTPAGLTVQVRRWRVGQAAFDDGAHAHFVRTDRGWHAPPGEGVQCDPH
jgi:3',5'-cyclic AMP phosphodiesterase CpdA